MAKNEIVMENYFDALEKVKNKIIQTQNQVMREIFCIGISVK